MLWPDKELCPDCWNINERGNEWNKDAVYKFLRFQYWAEDNFVDFGGIAPSNRSTSQGDRQSQQQQQQPDKEPTLMDADPLLLSRGTLISSNVFSFVIVPIGAVGLYALLLKWEKERLGKMKKFDDTGRGKIPPIGRFSNGRSTFSNGQRR